MKFRLLICSLFALALMATAGEVKDPNRPAGVNRDGNNGPDNFGYEAQATSYSGVDISDGTPALTGDDDAVVVNLGGNGFEFYGEQIDDVLLSTNGYISTNLADDGADFSSDCPIPTAPGNGDTGARIMPYHDDFVAEISGVFYEYQSDCDRGSGPCHVFQWNDVEHWPADGVTFDVVAVLYETGVIVYEYGPGNPELGSGGTAGVMAANAADGMQYVCHEDGGIPDNSAVQISACSVSNMYLSGYDLSIMGNCSGGVDVYAVSDSGTTLVEGGLVLAGSETLDVTGHDDSYFVAVAAGGDPNAPLALTASRTVPTLGEWGMIAFLTLIALAGLFFIRKRPALD